MEAGKKKTTKREKKNPTIVKGKYPFLLSFRTVTGNILWVLSNLDPLHPFALLAYNYQAPVLTAIALFIPLAEGCTTFPSLSLDVLMSLHFHERPNLIVP